MVRLLFILLLLPVCMRAQIITTVAGTSAEGFAGDGGAAVNAQMHTPEAIAFDKSGNMYVVDALNYRVRMISTSGIITTVAGNGTRGSAGDGGPATAAELWPVSVATDSADNLYISETTRIRKVDVSGTITTIAGNDTLGYNGDGIPATDAKLRYPYLGYIDGAGAVYFSDEYNHRIRKIDAAGIISTLYGTGISGNDGDGGPASAASFNSPYFLYRSASGEIYVPDGALRRTRKIATDGTIDAFAGYGLGGSSGGDGGPATIAAVASVTSVVCDDSGNVYMCMSNANTIRKVNAAGIISTPFGTGTDGYAGDNGPASLAEFSSPAQIAIYKGNLFIADRYNNCVRKISFDKALSAATVAGADTRTVLYPDPATDNITLASATAITKVVVMNMAGQIVASYNRPTATAEKTATISTHTMPPGLYVVQVNDGYAGRFVKQ